MNKRIYYKNHYLQFDAEIAYDKSTFNKTIDELLQGKNGKIPVSTEEELDQRLAGRFTHIEAAGGLICRDNEWLFIYRHKRWDLPKGKLEPGESPESGAIRECEEECGITGLHITGKLPYTYHIYEYKGGFAFKRTHWYLMTTEFRGKLKPQLEESIEQVEWFDDRTIKTQILPDTYFTIHDLVQSALFSSGNVR